MGGREGGQSGRPVPAEGAYARVATSDDLAHLVDLYEAAVPEISAMRGGALLVGLHARRGPSPQAFGAALADSHQRVVVGLLGPGTGPSTKGWLPPEDGTGAVVGYGVCRTVTMAMGEKVGTVEDLYVRPPSRRHGVGRAMSDHLVGWCQEQGCIGIDAWALPGSRAVKSFFEGRKFIARALVMHHKL